jgi:hypothetical protein
MIEGNIIQSYTFQTEGLMRNIVPLLSICILISALTVNSFADELNKQNTVKPVTGVVSEINLQELTILVEFTEQPACKPGDIIDITNAKGSFPVTVEEISVSSIICSVPRYSIAHINAGDAASFTTASSRQDIKPKIREDEKKSNKRKIDRPQIFFYGKTNTSDFQSTSAVYEKQSGVLLGGVQIAFDKNRNGFEVQYKKPFYSEKDTAPKDTTILVFFSSGEINGKVAYHWLDNPEHFNTSNYFEGILNLQGNQLFFKPVLTYQHKYFTDDYNGDRKKQKDYQASCKFSPLHLDDTSFHFSFDVAAHYVSEQYIDMLSTPQYEGRKGFRDVLGDAWIGIGNTTMLKTGFTYTRIINEKWRTYTGSSQYLWYCDFRMAFDSLYITLRYDNLRQPDGTFGKNKNLYTASFRYSI